MLAYVMVGTNNVKRAAKFYDAALAPLGLVRTWSDNRSLGYSPKNAPKKSMFYVTKPYNKKPASFGNGTMISLAAKSRRAVEGFHAAALANGGTDEGKPGPRPAGGSNYVAYARDPDGNKICAYCAKAK
jgi:catechol 2,3-dioxygenase-like lactoylglutathione lyase family enzyme